LLLKSIVASVLGDDPRQLGLAGVMCLRMVGRLALIGNYRCVAPEASDVKQGGISGLGRDIHAHGAFDGVAGTFSSCPPLRVKSLSLGTCRATRNNPALPGGDAGSSRMVFLGFARNPSVIDL
jgi:hypothetical protein